MRGREDGVSLPELLVAALLIGIALVPLLHLYPGTLGFNVETEVDTVLSAAAVRKTEELIGALRAPTGDPVAFDAASSASGTSITTLSWTHTTGTGSDRLLVVGVDSLPSPVVSGVTYGGTALTVLRTDQRLSVARTEIWYLVNPVTGANTITVTMSASTGSLVGGAVTFTGAHQTTPISNHNGIHNKTKDASLDVISATGEMVIDTLSSNGGTSASVGAGQTQRWNLKPSLIGAGSTEPGAATVTMSWTLQTTTTGWVLSGASVKAAGAAAPTSGTAACTDLPNCQLVWTIATELSGAIPGTLKTVQVVACQDTNGNSACDSGERQVRYDAKITSRT